MECAKGVKAEIDADIAMDDADAINLKDEDDKEMRGGIYNIQSVLLKILFSMVEPNITRRKYRS